MNKFMVDNAFWIKEERTNNINRLYLFRLPHGLTDDEHRHRVLSRK